MRDVVAVEVDRPFVAGGQVEAGRVAAGQGPIRLTGGFGLRVGREILANPGYCEKLRSAAAEPAHAQISRSPARQPIVYT